MCVEIRLVKGTGNTIEKRYGVEKTTKREKILENSMCWWIYILDGVIAGDLYELEVM